MRKRTRWKRAYPTIIRKRFHDDSEYMLGYFTVLKAWKCKTYDKNCKNYNDSHWFSKSMILIKTDDGRKYKIPFCPWSNTSNADTGELWSEEYNAHPW